MWGKIASLLGCRTAAWAAGVLLAGASALAQTVFPALTGRVVDEAGLLSASLERELTEQLREHEDATTNQVVVVTVTTLQGLSIEQYGRALGNHWRIGQKDKNNGILLVVAPNERKVRIEVGLGLESVLTNTIAQDIIDRQILPHFRGGDFEFGVRQGAASIVSVLVGTYGQGGERRPESVSSPQGDGRSWWEALLAWILAPFFLIARFFGFGGSGSDGGSFGGDFSGGGGSFGGGGASGSW